MKIPGIGRGGPPAYEVVVDACWDDPSLDRFATAMRSADPAADRLDAAETALRSAAADPERMTLLAEIAAEPLACHLDVLRARLADGAPDADRLALAAAALVHAAWQVRGDGRSATVTPQSWTTFHRLCDEADETGRRALLLRPGHPVAAVYRLNSGLGLGLVGDEWWQRFDVARLECRTLVAAHHCLLQALCDKWYGDHETMFEFARRTAAEAPAGHPVAAVLAVAHLELWAADTGPGGQHRRDQERRQDDAVLRGHSAALLAADTTVGRHPRALEAHQAYAWWYSFAARSGETTAAWRSHLVRTRGRRAKLPWTYYDDPGAAFRDGLAAARVTPAELAGAR